MPLPHSRSTPLLVFTVFALLSAGCGDRGEPREGASGARDIASDFGTIFSHHLYYRDGADIVRAGCNPNTILYDRAVCQRDPQRVPAAAFYHELQSEFGAHAEELGARASEVFVRIQQIDAKILELLSSSGSTPSHPELAAQIKKLETEFNEHTGVIISLRQQIVLIQQTLAAGDDPDLRLQLALLESKMSARIEARASVQAQLTKVRDDYAQANIDLLDGQLFDQLQSQRAQSLELWEVYQVRQVNEGREAVDLQRVIAMLEDDYVFLEDLGSSSKYMAIIMIFNDVIDDLAKGPMRYGKVGAVTDLRLSVDVPAWSTLKSMQCRFDANVENRCTEIRITGPEDASGSMENLFLHTRYDQDAGIGANSLINLSAKGQWTFTIVSTCGSQPIVLKRAPWCELGVD